MFYLLGGEKPTSKVLLTGVLEDGATVEYMATRTREVCNVYNDVECLASFYVTVSVIESAVNGEQESAKIQVGGSQWEKYKYLIGLQDDGLMTEEKGAYQHLGLVRKIGSGNVKKEKDLTYATLNGGKSDVVAKIGHGNSIEDYLYEIRSIKEIAEEKGISLEWAKEKDYRVLVTDSEIEEFIEGLKNTNNKVGFDTETTGLLANRTKRDIIVGISMSYEDNTGVYIPLNHIRFQNVHMGEQKLLQKLKPYIDRRFKKRKHLIGHNIGFDYRVLKMYGIELNIMDDTFIRFSLVRIQQAKYMGGLKAIASNMLGYEVLELSDMFKPKTKADISLVKDAVFKHGLAVNPITRYKLERAVDFGDLKYDFRFASYEFAELYGSADADFPRLIDKMIDEFWDNELDFVYQLELALIPSLAEQEYYGIYADREAFDKLHEDTLARLSELEELIYKEAGQRFKITSTPEKARIIFDVLKCPFLPRFKTKSGGRSTDKNVMETLAEYRNKDGSPMYPIIPLLQEYSKLKTLVSNFYGKLPSLIHDGYLFPSYKQMGTETGRMSCSNPNLQQTEKTSRKHMKAESDDYYFLICDYSQVEYRIMAGMSGEKKVVDFFANNPEADYHILAYANMMNKAYEDVTSAERKVGKVLNFGTTYGLEDANLALKLYGNDTPLHQMMARQARTQYFAGVPVLRDYFEAVRDEAQINGFVRTMFGRRRDIEEFQYKGYVSEYKIASGRRKAGNMPVQGTAADIMKMALVRLRDTMRKQGWEEDMVRQVGNIHDEVIIQVHKSINPWYILKYVREAMEIDLTDEGFPPLYIGANVGYTWADGKVDELEAPVLLMDEKIAEIEELLASGVRPEELPTWDDPRTMWLEEISKFACRQVLKQIEENGYTTVSECHKDGRLVKYVKHFGKNEDNIIQYMLDKRDWVWVYENMDSILAEEKLVVVEEQKAVEKGKEIVETVLSVEDMIKKVIRFNRKENLIKVQLVDADSEFLDAIDKLVVDFDEEILSAFNEDTFYRVSVSIGESGIPEELKFKRLPKFMGKLLKKYAKAHVLGTSLGDYINEIDEHGTKYVRQDVLEVDI